MLVQDQNPKIGWGKNWACMEGYQKATGELVSLY